MRSRVVMLGSIGALVAAVWAASSYFAPPAPRPGTPGVNSLAAHTATCPYCSQDDAVPVRCPELRRISNGKLGWNLRPDSLRRATPVGARRHP